jgi:Fe-S cluster assembly protein SufD
MSGAMTDMPRARTDQDPYTAQFDRLERRLASQGPHWLPRLRRAAIASFGELGLPTSRNEDWKFTSVAHLTKEPFTFALDGAPQLDMAAVRDQLFDDAVRLVFVNGRFSPTASVVNGLPKGALVESLATALASRPELIEAHLGRTANHRELPFTALNTAFLTDGAFVYLPTGAVLDRPVHFLYVTAPDGGRPLTYPRNLIVAERGAQAAIVETYVGLADAAYFTNAVTEVVVGENVILDHYKVQQEGPQATHIANTQIQQGKGSNFKSHYIGLGGALIRNEARLLFTAEGSEATINGLYLASGRQHMDNHTVIDHAKPHCASHELYKGILDGKAHGVFNGKIFVRQDAQKTDAKQTNQTLLLSDEATIDTKPQLEIFADDVKCTHGATVGQLDAESLFYLRSRGLGLEEARSLLLFAFANDIVSRIKIPTVRNRLEMMLLEARRLPKRGEGA